MKIFNNNITQYNIGDTQGTLYNTFNCDLTYNKGKMSIASRTIFTPTALTPLDGTPVGFKYFDNKWFTIAGTKVYKNSGSPVANFVEETTGTPPTNCSSDYSDLEVFSASAGDVLLVSSVDALYSRSTDAVGTGFTLRRTFSGGSGQNHPICVYNNRAYWLDIDSKIYSTDNTFTNATSGTYTMSLPNEYKVLWMRAFSNGIHIGTIHRYGGDGLVFEWDGVTVNKWNRAYKVFAQGALAGFVSQDIPYVVNSNAELLQFTGSGFKVIARLPTRRNKLFKANEISTNTRFIHPNGLCEIDGYMSMLINNQDNNTTTVEYQDNIHSGIWEYDDVSLYHKHSLSYRTRPDSGGSITDYGQISIARAGGLAETPDLYGTSEVLKGNFLAGAEYYTDATTTAHGIWTDSFYDEVEKCGFFVTSQIRASNIEEMFNYITTLFVPTQGFNFVVKYRTERAEHVDFTITWTSTDTFTTTQTGLAKGNEVTITRGKGSGRIAHISAISENAGTYTVTLDEQITGVSGTAKARKENWIKVNSINTVTNKFQKDAVNQPDTLIEIKVAMLGTGDTTVDEIILDNVKNQ